MGIKTKLCLALTVVLVILGTVSVIQRLLVHGFVFQYIMILLMYLSIIVYSFSGYKKPNGHRLKGLFLRYEVIMLTFILADIDYSIKLNVMLYAAAGMCIAYIAADLKNVNTNRWIMLAVTILLVAVEFRTFFLVGQSINFFKANMLLTPIYMWATLCAAFYTRYMRSAEDGLSTDPIPQAQPWKQ